MEFVRFSTQQLNALGDLDPVLRHTFVKACAADQLPVSFVNTNTPRAYVVNTHPISKPGEHWIALWTYGHTCEIIDSYGLDLNMYQDAKPLRTRLKTHFKQFKVPQRSLQSIRTASCGHYAIVHEVLP